MDDTQPQKPNLDLIQMVQHARLMHDKDAKPSQISAVYWIEVKCTEESCQNPTPNTGQWVLNTHLAQVDAIWEKIKQATQTGQLGYKSKVSTASRSGQNPESRTICILTYNANDDIDVQRVLEAIQKLEIMGEWHYERDPE